VTNLLRVGSATDDDCEWAINPAHVVMVRRTDGHDGCVIVLTSGQITPRQTYKQVTNALGIRDVNYAL